MSRYGLKIARLFGKTLPAFSSQAEAETVLLAFRDAKLRRIHELASNSPDFRPDYTPESLKALERLYFQLYESKSFEKIGSTREEFEECMAMYFGEVVVRNIPTAKWAVQEFAFEKGKYEIGVQKGLTTIMLRRFTDHFKTPNNKKQEWIWRQFKQYCT